MDSALQSFLHHLRDWLNAQIAALDPGCFAIVMATGIISNAMLIDGRRECSDALFAVNVIAYPLLFLVTIIRMVQFWKDLWADLTNPRLVFSFFTIVAGTDVFGVGANLRGFATVALVLWLCALVLWLLLIYFSFGVLAFSNSAQSADIIHGGWLNAIVGTQSMVILGTVVAPAFGSLSPTVLVLIHMLWSVGLGLYAIFIALFAHRMFFFQVEPDDVTPILWVVMGAAAISTDAGSTLIKTEAGMPFLDAMRPFIDGVSLLMWAWGTWWIPLLLLLGIWKHRICRLPLTYTPMLWSLVFPLGMYAVASFRLSLAADFAPLQSVAKTVMWVAFGAWIVTGIALGAASWRSFSRATQSRKTERK